MSRTFEHDGCIGCKYEKESESSDYCKGCKQNAVDKYVRMTNADRIRSMTDDELAYFLHNIIIDERAEWSDVLRNCLGDKRDAEYKNNYFDIKEWLEREVEE